MPLLTLLCLCSCPRGPSEGMWPHDAGVVLTRMCPARGMRLPLPWCMWHEPLWHGPVPCGSLWPFSGLERGCRAGACAALHGIEAFLVAPSSHLLPPSCSSWCSSPRLSVAFGAGPSVVVSPGERRSLLAGSGHAGGAQAARSWSPLLRAVLALRCSVPPLYVVPGGRPAAADLAVFSVCHASSGAGVTASAIWSHPRRILRSCAWPRPVASLCDLSLSPPSLFSVLPPSRSRKPPRS